MQDNKVQFAVVREDPMVEAELIRLTKASNVLLVASGGVHCPNIAGTVSRFAYHAG